MPYTNPHNPFRRMDSLPLSFPEDLSLNVTSNNFIMNQVS